MRWTASPTPPSPWSATPSAPATESSSTTASPPPRSGRPAWRWPWVIAGLTDIPEVRAEALKYLPWAAISPLIAVWSFQLDGIYWGAARGREMRNSMILAGLCFSATAWALVPHLGNHGLWLAMMVLMVVRAATLGARLPALLRSVDA